MATTTLSSREFNQDTSRAKKAARKGPVIITDRGEPAHVLMTIEDYRKLTGESLSLRAAIEDKGSDFEFEVPKLKGPLSRPAKFK